MNEEPYTVKPVSVEDTTDYEPGKGSYRAKRVNYQLPDGTRSYVVIPHEAYTAENVAARLQAEAQKHAEVMAVRVSPTAGYSTGIDNPFGSG